MRLAPAFAVSLALALALGGAGCSEDDDPTAPAVGQTIDFPGDAATLQEAIDMASAGDTVRVGAGSHPLDTTLVFDPGDDGVVLVGRAESEAEKRRAPRPVIEIASDEPVDGVLVRAGVADVTIRGLEIRGDLRTGVGLLGPGSRLVDCVVDGARGSGVSCTQPSSDGTIEGNLILDAAPFGVFCLFGAHPTIVGNTIVGAGDCGIYASSSSPSVRRNIIFDSANWGIACFGEPYPSLSCNALFASGNDDYSPECPGDSTDVRSDPLFCDLTSYGVMPNSPCAAANAGACGRIGAVGVCE